MIVIDVLGIPKGQPRARAYRSGNRVRVYDPGTAENWKGCIALAARPQLPKSPITGPVSLQIHYMMQRPKSLMRKSAPDGMLYHTGKPDIDNMNKATMDALTGIGMWRDDCQVCSITASKMYASKDGTTGAMIVINEIEGDYTAEK